MKFHPYSEILPLIEGADLDALVADIATHGLREKIWTYEGKILDGRNRFFACEKIGIDPEFRKYTGDDPLAFVISLNIQRRHLNESQRAMAAARIATLRKGGNQHSEGVPIGTSSKMVNASERSTKRARKVIEKGSKSLQSAVDSGDVSVSRAASVVDLPKSEQLAAATAAPEYDFTGYVPEDDAEYQRSIDNVMMADDKLAAMREELKQAHREIQALKASRDHYQAECGQAVRIAKAKDREIARLKKELTRV